MNNRRKKVEADNNQLNTQLVQPTNRPKEKNELAIEFGKFCLDLAKLTFGGMFLSSIMDVSYDMTKVIQWCAVVIVVFALIGFMFIKHGINK